MLNLLRLLKFYNKYDIFLLLWACSSAVEHHPYKVAVDGSNPSRPTFIIIFYPCRSMDTCPLLPCMVGGLARHSQRPCSLTDKILASEAEDAGSIPTGGTGDGRRGTPASEAGNVRSIRTKITNFMNEKEQKFIVNIENHDSRLDVFLVEKLGLTRSQVQKMIEAGLVIVNNKLPKKAGDRIKEGAQVRVAENIKEVDSSISESEEIREEAVKIDIEVLAETDQYLVINKPSRLLVHPTEAKEKNTLVAWLLNKYPQIKKVGESPERPGIVHRLDKEASGLLVIAKTQMMFDCLKKQFQARTVDKEYSVLVHDVVIKDNDIVDFDIDRGRDGKMVSRPKVDKLSLDSVKDIQEGKEAITEIFVQKRYARYTLLKVKIYTGRTNQIRVHMLAHSHPVVGDTLYFNKKLNRKRDLELGRIFLHSTKLCFDDLKGERSCFESKLPVELSEFLKKLT